ncbi:MAG TPA: hypothetical protein EYQ14_24870 [Gammaproteobacteria bacterium]|nr:hypothetical protein [Gammaproteobacteria bacterium]HIL96348.1 hypothetical protein [Pseudomonadales bacterium]
MNLFDLIGLAVLVVTSFATTNLDNLLILVFLLGNSPHARFSVLVGFIVSVILVITVSGLGLVLGAIINPSLVGYLGFAPFTLGCYLLYQQRKSLAVNSVSPAQTLTGSRIWLASVVLMFSNSADSIAVLLPLLAESDVASIKLIVVIYLLTSIAWCGLSLSIASRPELAERIGRHGEKFVPWVMLAVGIYVLMNTGTDTLARGVTTLLLSHEVNTGLV